MSRAARLAITAELLRARYPIALIKPIKRVPL
jgi:hypothetical protein